MTLTILTTVLLALPAGTSEPTRVDFARDVLPALEARWQAPQPDLAP